MQSGPLEFGSSVDYSLKTPEKKPAGAQVELQIVAVNLSSATSAAASLRADEISGEVRPPSAASLELSARAQRLALIPAQVMDPEELAQAQEELERAERQLHQVHADTRRASTRPDADPPRSRPSQTILAHGRSPFESAAPGSTGQSIDIVVGEPTL